LEEVEKWQGGYRKSWVGLGFCRNLNTILVTKNLIYNGEESEEFEAREVCS
jgi:hypothetical protein